MTRIKALEEAVKTAGIVAAGIADSDLRRIAFDRVLEHLLTQTEIGFSRQKANVRRAESSVAARRTTGRGAAAYAGPSSWVEKLLDEGYFSEARTITDVVREVKASGHSVKSKDVSFPLVRLVRLKKLRRVQRVDPTLQRNVWVYTNY